MSESSLFEQLKSHVGGLVRVRYDDGGASGLNGKIGLLMGVFDPRRVRAGDLRAAQIELLIDGSVKILVVYTNELELIGADDAR